VSCLYAHLDPARGRLTLASAGHLPPLLRLSPHHARVLDVEPGPLLGIDPRAPYPVTTLPLPGSAVLVLYTDGLVETPGTDTDSTTAALVRHLADADDRDLEELTDGLVRRIWPTGRHTDDIALLLLRTPERR
jgi:serine phosphatase RsbU (regulator of sigma subunit)